jgi:hypothetical protein
MEMGRVPGDDLVQGELRPVDHGHDLLVGCLRVWARIRVALTKARPPLGLALCFETTGAAVARA